MEGRRSIYIVGFHFDRRVAGLSTFLYASLLQSKICSCFEKKIPSMPQAPIRMNKIDVNYF
jgi:hypothetical protein